MIDGPKIVVECQNTSCRHHDHFTHCKAESISIVLKWSDDESGEETSYFVCESEE